MKRMLLGFLFIVGMSQHSFSGTRWSGEFSVATIWVTHTQQSATDLTPGPLICAVKANIDVPGSEDFLAFYLDEKTEPYLRILMEAKATGKKVQYWYEHASWIEWYGLGSVYPTKGKSLFGVAFTNN